MISFTQVRDPLLSVWQSSVDEVLANTPGRAGADDPFMIATNAVVHAVGNRLKQPGASMIAPADPLAVALASVGRSEIAEALPFVAPTGRVAGVFSGAAAIPIDCAKTALQIAHAKLVHNNARAEALEELLKFGKCDPMWGECITQFLENAAIPGQAVIPYIPWNAQNDYVLDLPDPATIAIVGDWGTGGLRAAALLRSVARHSPNIFIHLGDIYFSGTDHETQNYFIDVIDKILPNTVKRLSLPGNHDMYSGGKPYYEKLLPHIGQPASFFCMQNANWQIQAMDTAFNDFNPLNVNSIITSVQEHEMEWHVDKLESAAMQNRKTILLSHHQLFSATEAFDGTPVNHKLLNQFAAWIPGVSAWIWGHEHSHIIFEEYLQLKKGRCMGASAMPVPANDPNENPYRTNPAFGELAPRISSQQLTVDPALGLYNLGYALLRISGSGANLEHYQSNSDSPFFVEAL
jgi:hypothetical protein